jgi:peptide/nickel transport system substrate-binding protein
MIDRKTRLKFRRRVRHSKQQVEDFSVQAEEQLERNFLRRLPRLVGVRRFVFGWLFLLTILMVGVGMQLRALDLKPVPGGTYTEGIIGTFTNANPLYATSITDTTVSRLIFASLLKYDNQNHLVGDLADTWKVSPDGKSYSVVLRPDLTWQDGQPLTSEDVVFTFQTIQNPDAKSPLFHGLQGVKIKANGPRQVTFTLPGILASFPQSLTTGIVPKHVLHAIPPAQLRSATFNTARPIGAGPFKWNTIELTNSGDNQANQQQIGLVAFSNYHTGPAKLSQFVIKTYPNEDMLADSFKKQNINAMVGIEHLPESLGKSKHYEEYSIPLTAETMVFFKSDSDILKDSKVRQALTQAVNTADVVGGLGYPAVLANEPILKSQLGYNASAKQLGYNKAAAEKLLSEAGWKQSATGQVRKKGTTELSLRLYAPNKADYAAVSQRIQKAWQEVGVKTEVILPDEQELQATISGRQYDALLYGISIGADPDVFAYWHSSQADVRSTSRLNFSDYKSPTADKALEGGRTRIDPQLRTAKYLPFLQTWRADAPAIALYQPRFYYVTHERVFGLDNKTVNTAADRFANVENWMVIQEPSLKD